MIKLILKNLLLLWNSFYYVNKSCRLNIYKLIEHLKISSYFKSLNHSLIISGKNPIIKKLFYKRTIISILQNLLLKLIYPDQNLPFCLELSLNFLLLMNRFLPLFLHFILYLFLWKPTFRMAFPIPS